MMTETANARGCLLGLACGDALGRPVEFKSATQIASQHGEVTEMLGHGTHGQPPGTITDDTELALCIAESLVEHGAFRPGDIADRFVGWLYDGPFDVGLMTREAIIQLREGHSWETAGEAVWETRPEGSNAGNGSVMRCAPYALAYHDDPDVLVEVSRASSGITHADPRCRWGCAVLDLTLAGLLQESDAPLTAALARAEAAPDELLDAVRPVEAVVAGQASPESLDGALSSSGYVLDTLQTALYDGLLADSAEAAIVRAVSRGGDADTVGAVAGAIAGARFGAEALPKRWLAEISEATRLRELAEPLLDQTFETTH